MIQDENAAYHADKSRIGKSGLDLINKSPAHYYAKYLDPNRVRETPTPALAFGSALHTMVFEPFELVKRFVVAPEINRRTNAGKEEYSAFMEANKGKTIIDADVLEHCKLMKEAVYNNPVAALLLESGVAEQRIDWEWNGEKDGQTIHVPCKIKPDWYSNTQFLVDLKTTEDASPDGFGKSIANYRYHVQGAFYLDGMTYAQGGELPKGFVFIAVEKSPPYAVALYYLTPEQINYGRTEYERNLRTYHTCITTGQWPLYNDGKLMPATMPAWAFKRNQ